MAYAVAYCVWRSVATGAEVGMSWLDRFAFVIPGLLTVTLAWLASTDRRLEAPARRGWRLLAAAFLSIELGNLLWVLDWTFPRSQIPLAHVGWLAYYPLLLAGILSFPRATRSHAERVRFWIDTAAVVCGGAMLVVYLVRVPGSPVVSGLEAVVSLAYPVGDVALLMGVAVLALRRREDPARVAYLLLTIGLLIEMAGDIAWGSLSLAGASPYRAFPDVTYMIGWALRGSAAFAHRRRTATTIADPRVAAARDHAGESVLPYGAAILGYTTLFLALDAADPSTVRVLAAGAAALTALAFLSQWLTARENARLEAERAERRSESRFRALVQSSSDLVAVMDQEGFVTYVAPSAEGILGRSIADLPGQAFAALVHPDDRLGWRMFLAHATVQPGVSAPVELRIGEDGSWIAMEALATNMLAQPEIEGIVLRLRDVRERKELEEQLMHRALHDPLTGLANRALFHDRMNRARQRADESGARFGVLVLDLDDFKAVNDGLGHATGDQVLVEMARRLRATVRPIDTAARLGGDEFAVLLEGIEGEDAARRVGETILQASREPFVVPPREIRLAASIGLALSVPGLAEEETLRQADLALYHAKELGKGRLATFAPGMRSEMLRRHTIEAELRRSIEHGEMELLWQPLYSLRSGRAVGAEALVRWRHPQRGIVAPAEFIHLAEISGLIEPLGQWVIEEACRQGADWNRGAAAARDDGAHRGEAPRPFHVGVNLSVRQLHDRRVVEQVRAALDRHRLPADRLVCEITESQLARDPLAISARLRELEAAGVRLALDDFGTGYSSLGRLRDLPIDVLKIDGVFAQDVESPQGRSLAAAIVELGKAVGLLVVAEGVETAGQAAVLRALGCDLAQGFHFRPPVAAAEVSRLQRPLLAG